MLKSALKFKGVRYIISGGIATFVDLCTYYLCLHFIFFNAQYIKPITTPTASLMVSYSFGFLTNFTISKLFVFKGSDLRTRHQLMRYFLVALLIFVFNYLFMKLFLFFEIYPTISRALSIAVVAGFSFLMHNHYTFRLPKDEELV